jgi:tetratricopeptide (TPR) repeat protein
MPLLELSVQEDPHCPRNAFYYARELTFYRRWVDAVVALNKYLDNPKADWANERCYAMRLMAQCYEALGDAGTAKVWLERATREAPNTREPWVELADLGRKTDQWELCRDAAGAALRITDKALVYTMDPTVWGARPHDLLALAAYNLGDYDTAIEHGMLACDIEPSDARLSTNLAFYTSKKAA